MRELKTFVVFTLVAIFAACGQTATNSSVNTTATNAKPAANGTPPAAATPPAVSSAATLYSTSCAKCHKEDGSGGKMTVDGKSMNPDNLTSPKIAGKSDEKIYGYIADGFPDDGMPAFKDKLKPEEIKQIVAYIRSDLQKGGAKPAETK